ncbi:DNA polymerase III subunit gamma/tau [Amycolatopsis sp. WAC 01375]|uniref:DNA polymerase III subunit gamma and tau n=1 Tax=unclassified Amycolatopsis TaxID=2618356 RepID=UPI000F7B255E|nr:MULTISPECIES: DNA polymerase III subunit gamma and tau [unclassified Amycolatopsis]RSM79242.1 DNA polymerase III subunit gamma/tau [Amycolatopsis sp. WAC 01375]RSN37655.1 DNA polymerase III subunit gamma/tau [Amycolatopsis sp. WAC 01416]
MALALYRKYRPATFAEVVGQEHVTDPLRTALAAGRINHAYLFSGPRGCGKTSSARIMARSLNCAKGPTPDPCGECNSCRNLAPEGPGSVDVTELDAASHGGVDDARELRDRAFYAPADSRYRVFIIDEAHMVTTQGFNALLKIVEEPPEHLIFIFATTEPDKVLPTIRSRTHHYPFRLIPPSSMRELLERNVAAEGAQVEPAVYPLVIRAGGGSARDTQSVLDQLLAGAGPDGVDYSRAVSLLGVTDVALIDGMVDALAADDAAAVFGTVESLAEAGHDPRRFATDLLDRLRDLVMLRSVPDAGERGLVAAPDDELKKMKEQAGKLEPATLSRYADIVHNGLLEMRGATSPRLVLELLTARMLLPSVAEGTDALLARLERLERRAASAPAPVASAPAQAAPAAQAPQAAPVAQSAPVPAATSGEPVREFQRPSQRPAAPAQQPAPSPQAAPASQPVTRPEPVAERPAPQRPSAPTPPPAAPAAAAAPSGGSTDVDGIRARWPQVQAAIRKIPGGTVTGAMLTQASVVSVEGNAVTLTHNAEPVVRRLSEPLHTERIAAAFKAVFEDDWQIRCVHGAAQPRQAAAPKAAPPPSAPERSFTRRSAEAPSAAPAPSVPKPEPQRSKVVTTEPDIPLPPEPAEEDEDLYNEDASPAPPPPPLPPEKDPEEIARKLLADHLNARPLDERK